MKITRYAVTLLGLLLSSALLVSAQNESWKRLSVHGKHPSEHRKTDMAVVPNANGAKNLNQEVDRIEKQPHSRAAVQKSSHSQANVKTGMSPSKTDRNPPINFNSTSHNSAPAARKSGSGNSKSGNIRMGR